MTWLAPLDIGLMMGIIFAWAVLALALGFRLLNFPDLTVEGSLPLGAAVFSVMFRDGSSIPISIITALLAGALAGSLTALLHVRFRLNKFLAGIIVIAISYSLSLRVMGAANIGLLQYGSFFEFVEPLDKMLSGFLHLGTISFLGTVLLISMIVLFVGLSSRMGTRLRVAGSNPEYARTLGISVPLNTIFGLAVFNSLAAFSGVLLAVQQGFADISMGQGVLILALAAMAIGERLLPERRLPYQMFVVLSASLGSILYQVVIAYAIRLGLAPTDLRLATALLVLLVVAISVSRDRDLFAEGY
ncbi:ABC transporter permease [Nitrospinota bacterium]